MKIDGFKVAVEHTKAGSFLSVRGWMGITARITLEQLEAWIAELSQEARRWRRSELPDLYAILQVPRSATAAEIKAAYRQKMKVHHPDTGGQTDTTQAINQAYAVLGDPEKRRMYDHQTIN